MPSGSTVPPPNDLRIPVQPINSVNPVDSKDVRRKKGLSKAKRKVEAIFLLGFVVLSIGVANTHFLGDYWIFYPMGFAVMIGALIEAIFAVAKFSK